MAQAIHLCTLALSSVSKCGKHVKEGEDGTLHVDAVTCPSCRELAGREPVRMVSCDDCDWHGLENETDELADVLERVSPGEPMPVGQCPECGAVCHYDDTPDAPDNPDGGVFGVVSGVKGDARGVLGPLLTADFGAAEKLAEGQRKPGRWAAVQEIDAFASLPAAPLFVRPDVADVIGGIGLQALADRYHRPVITFGSAHHSGKCYWPAPPLKEGERVLVPYQTKATFRAYQTRRGMAGGLVEIDGASQETWCALAGIQRLTFPAKEV